jgi:hypothetical protein
MKRTAKTVVKEFMSSTYLTTEQLNERSLLG